MSKNPAVTLMKQRSNLIQSIKSADDDLKENLLLKLSELEVKISELTAEENRKQDMDNFLKLSNTDGSTNMEYGA